MLRQNNKNNSTTRLNKDQELGCIQDEGCWHVADKQVLQMTFENIEPAAISKQYLIQVLVAFEHKCKPKYELKVYSSLGIRLLQEINKSALPLQGQRNGMWTNRTRSIFQQIKRPSVTMEQRE